MQVRVRPKNEEKRSSMEKRKKGSTVSLSKTELQKSVGPILSLRRGGVKDATGQVLVFLVKVAALEAFRRGSQGKYRPLWWGLQSLSVFQAPPLKWLQRWAPFRFLAQATQVCLLISGLRNNLNMDTPVSFRMLETVANLAVCIPNFIGNLNLTHVQTEFSMSKVWDKPVQPLETYVTLCCFLQSFSKPMICLSLATVVASAYKEVSQEKTPVVPHISSSSELPAIDVINGELKEEEIVVIDQQALTVGDLRQELENNGIVLPER